MSTTTLHKTDTMSQIETTYALTRASYEEAVTELAVLHDEKRRLLLSAPWSYMGTEEQASRYIRESEEIQEAISAVDRATKTVHARRVKLEDAERALKEAQRKERALHAVARADMWQRRMDALMEMSGSEDGQVAILASTLLAVLRGENP